MSLGENISKVTPENTSFSGVDVTEFRDREVFRDADVTAAWFAGVFEVGATACISVTEHKLKNGRTYPKTLPTVEIRTRDAQMRQRLFDTFGGTNKSHYWSKAGRTAAEIIAFSYPYTVARKEHAAAALVWLNAESVEEQIIIAREALGLEWQQKGDSEEYSGLLENPAFVAGVLDSRSYIATRPANNYHALYIQTTSKNITLLKSLQETYGGKIRITDPEGTEVRHGKVNFETKVDSYVWEIFGSEAIELVKFASPFVQTKLPDDWDFQRVVEMQQDDLQLAQDIANYVQKEIELVKAGKLTKASSILDLQAHFQIGNKRLPRLLKLAMDSMQQDERLRYSRKSTRAIFTEERVREIHAFIVQEIADFHDGKIDRISYRAEIAQRFGVSQKSVQRHILSSLDEKIRESREAIMSSQRTRERNIAYWKKKREGNSETSQNENK